MEQNKTELMLWKVYDIIRNLNDSDLNEAQILINREKTDRIRNKKINIREYYNKNARYYNGFYGMNYEGKFFYDDTPEGVYNKFKIHIKRKVG